MIVAIWHSRVYRGRGCKFCKCLRIRVYNSTNNLSAKHKGSSSAVLSSISALVAWSR
jgi:hypothetical protein